jgi:hypothetical protein
MININLLLAIENPDSCQYCKILKPLYNFAKWLKIYLKISAHAPPLVQRALENGLRDFYERKYGLYVLGIAYHLPRGLVGCVVLPGKRRNSASPHSRPFRGFRRPRGWPVAAVGALQPPSAAWLQVPSHKS